MATKRMNPTTKAASMVFCILLGWSRMNFLQSMPVSQLVIRPKTPIPSSPNVIREPHPFPSFISLK